MRRGKLYFGVVALLTILVVPLPILPAMSTNGVGWLSGWSHRKSHVINPALGAGTNYQVKIIVHYGYGTDSGADVYCNNECRTDFGDVRFTDNDGVTFLDYWIEEKTDSYNATFWVEVADDLNSNNVTIYLYYGNNDAITSSSGAKTFEFHIDKDNTTGWTKSNMDVTTSGDYLRFNNSIASNLGTAEKQLEISSHYYVVEYRGKNIDVQGIADQICVFTYDFSWNHRPHLTAHPYFDDQQDFMYAEGNFEEVLWDEGFQFDTEYILTAYVDETNSTNGVDYFVYDSSRVEKASKDDVGFAVGSPSKIDNIFIGDGTYSAGCDFCLRWLFIRKWTGNVEPSHGGWEDEQYTWLTGWGYRKSHIIQNASGADTNYQVRMVVHYGFGIDSGFDVFCDGRCRTDFGDIRFTDNDGITLLDYWMEKKTDSDKATFWVEVTDNLSSSDAKIFLYYGNPAASTTSDGDATFILFDSYDDNSLNTSKWNWQLDNNNASNVHLAEQNQRMESWKDAGSGVSGANYRESNDSWALERIVEFELYVDYDRTSIGGYAHQWQVWTLDDDNKLSCTHGSYSSTHFRMIMDKVEGGLHTRGTWAHFSWDTWYYVRTRVNSTSIVLEVFSGGFDETLEHVQYLSHTRTGNGSFHNRICSTSPATDGFRYFDDDFRVRKYTYLEPIHGSWGSEEFNWLPGWRYRKSHIINNRAGAGTNYQVKIEVHYGFGIDILGDVYCGNRCKADFGDIRFTDNDGVNLLDYWIEEKTDYDKALFWVEIADNLSSESVLIYMYYGNSGANTTSNGSTTFLWFDGFGGTSLDTSKWDLNNSPVVTVTGGECRISGDGGAGIIFKNEVDYDNVRIEHKAKRSDYNRRHTYSLVIGPVPHRSNFVWHYSGGEEAPMQEDITYTAFDGSWSGLEVVTRDALTNQYYLFSQWKTTDQYTPFIYDLLYRSMGGATTQSISDNPFKYYLFVHSIGSGTSEIVLDWVRIRKYVSAEPSHGAWKGSPTDDEPPVINYVNYSPTQPSYLEGVWVLAEVLDHSSLSTVVLHFNNGSGWASIYMFSDGLMGFNTTIPAQPAGTQVSFLLEATDTVGNAVNSSIYNYTVSDLPPSWTNFTIDARTTLNVMLDVYCGVPIQVDIAGVSMPGPSPPQLYQLGSAFRITANISSGFFISIYYYYTTQELNALGLNESTLAIYYWNTTDNSWYELSTSVDATNNELLHTIDHLTIFAVFGQAILLDGGTDMPWLFMISGIAAVAAIGIAILIKARPSRAREPVAELVAEPEARPPYEEEITPEEPMPEEMPPPPAEVEEPRPLPASEPICSYCGHQNPVGARYCIRCGRSLGEIHS